MWIEQPPLFYRVLFPECVWRVHNKNNCVYLTFDDGPIPEVTPWVLDLLDEYNIKATFFCVGDNVRRNPELFEEIKRRGHSVGNHTMNHLQGIKVRSKKYLQNVAEAQKYINSPLFRPPHGLLRLKQANELREHYTIIMYDVVSRDYDQSITGEEVFNIVKRYTRHGSILVFHDSIKAEKNLKYALPRAIEWLKENGYNFEPLKPRP